ncbi:MAG TPA: hypothetical protein DC049_06615, partial [Spirochaetia bacterium]|nr:hypothetical protein [Spirochaetia bacterium]
MRQLTALKVTLILLFQVIAIAALCADDFKIHFIQTENQADAILVQSPGGKTMLIDAGTSGDCVIIINYLNTLGITNIDVVYNTHAHGDHIGGMGGATGIFANFNVDKFYGLDDKDMFNYTPQYYTNQILPYSLNPAVTFDTLHLGDEILLDQELEILVLWPATNYTGSDYNNYSSTCLVTYKTNGKRFLFTADALYGEQKKLITDKTSLIKGLTISNYLKCDVLKYPHHLLQNQNPYFSTNFLLVTSPQFAVAPVATIVKPSQDPDWRSNQWDGLQQVYNYTWSPPRGLKSFLNVKNGHIVCTCTPEGLISFACSSNNLYS